MRMALFGGYAATTVMIAIALELVHLFPDKIFDRVRFLNLPERYFNWYNHVSLYNEYLRIDSRTVYIPKMSQ